MFGNTERNTLHLHMQTKVMTFKATEHFKGFIEKTAKKKGLSTGAYIKAVVAKHSKYKEPKKDLDI